MARHSANSDKRRTSSGRSCHPTAATATSDIAMPAAPGFTAPLPAPTTPRRPSPAGLMSSRRCSDTATHLPGHRRMSPRTAWRRSASFETAYGLDQPRAAQSQHLAREQEAVAVAQGTRARQDQRSRVIGGRSVQAIKPCRHRCRRAISARRGCAVARHGSWHRLRRWRCRTVRRWCCRAVMTSRLSAGTSPPVGKRLSVWKLVASLEK
jgi:hypothetical protein